MYAVVNIAGQQFKVEKDQKLFVHRLEGAEGKKVYFDQVLLIDTGSKISVGDPVIKGAAVSAKILAHVKGDKVLVFKKKKRKGYRKLNGHRQYLTQIQIESISEKAASTPAAAKPKAGPEPAKQKPVQSKQQESEAKAKSGKSAGVAEESQKEAAPKKSAATKTAPAKAASDKASTAKKETAAKKQAAKKGE